VLRGERGYRLFFVHSYLSRDFFDRASQVLQLLAALVQLPGLDHLVLGRKLRFIEQLTVRLERLRDANAAQCKAVAYGEKSAIKKCLQQK
jgi:hypothetical protein